MILNEIIQVIHPLQVVGNTDDLQGLDIQHLLTDSRQLGNAPEATLFFALKTHKNDGAKYIPQLVERGVKAFVVGVGYQIPEAGNHHSGSQKPAAGNHNQKPAAGNHNRQPETIIVVEDSLAALQQLAAYKRSLYTGPVIGITGSNGKTVVKEWLYQLLKDDYHITRSPRSYNSQIGVPLSVWQLNEQTELAIFEAGNLSSNPQ